MIFQGFKLLTKHHKIIIVELLLIQKITTAKSLDYQERQYKYAKTKKDREKVFRLIQFHRIRLNKIISILIYLNVQHEEITTYSQLNNYITDLTAQC